MKKYYLGTKLISNTFFISLEWAAVTIFSFLFWLIIGKTLSPENYGITSVFVNFTVIVGSLLSLGTSFALFKLIPEYIGRKKLGKISSSIRFTVKLLLITNLISSFFILIFSDFISSSLNVPKITVLLLPFSLFFFSFLMHQTSIMLGFQNAKRVAITSGMGWGLRTILVTIFIFFLSMKFLGPLTAFILGSVAIFLSRINYLKYKHKSEEINKKELLLKFGLPGFVAKTMVPILIYSQALILALFHSPEVVGILGISILLTSQIRVIPNIFSTALFPITSFLSADKNPKKRQAHFINLIFRYSILVIVPILIFVILFSGELIMLISQVTYLGAKPLIPILSIGSMLLGISYIYSDSLYAIGKPNIQRNLITFSVIVYLLLAFPLAYKFSALGISFAYAIAAFILFVSSFVYLKKILRFYIQWKSIIKLLFANLVIFSILFVLSNFAPNIFIGILYTLLVGVVYLFLLLFLRFYTEDDIKLLNKLVKHLPVGASLIRMLSRMISKFVEK